MPCKECGGHGGHHKPSCAFSPAVLQITNKDCTIFHRVEIPAAMGDETTVPPANGKYRNVLLTYEASGNAYLYSSDGIPTKLTFATSDYNALKNKPAINGVTLEGDLSSEDLHIEGGGGGEDPTVRLRINWDDPGIDNIRREGIFGIEGPDGLWSLLLDEDGDVYKPSDFYADLKANKRIVIEDFIIGGAYTPQTGAWEKGLATTVEILSRSPAVTVGRNEIIVFYVVAPINPFASQLGYTAHDAANWQPIAACVANTEGEEGEPLLTQLAVYGFGYYEKSA